MEEFDNEYVWKKLTQKWGFIDRQMIITPCYNDHECVGTILFSLDGSPPKGYAFYIHGHSTLMFIDNIGKNYKTEYNRIYDELDRYRNCRIYRYVKEYAKRPNSID